MTTLSQNTWAKMVRLMMAPAKKGGSAGPTKKTRTQGTNMKNSTALQNPAPSKAGSSTTSAKLKKPALYTTVRIPSKITVKEMSSNYADSKETPSLLQRMVLLE
jgi:hypothetical protein